MKAFYAAISLLLLLSAALFLYVSREIDSQHVLLRFERESSLSCATCNLVVYLDGAKIGALSNGEEKTFRLPPDATGVYEVGAQMQSTVGPNSELLKVNIGAKAGSVLYARWETDMWVWKMKAETRLRVAIERTPVGPPSLLPVSFTSATTQAVASFTPQEIKLPWDAIGAIAGILGTIAAIAALFK